MKARRFRRAFLKLSVMQKSKAPRIWMTIAILSLIGVFLFPLWQITLEAAQFPGGLRMDIWINKISGSSKNIIQNVNILNHYIGMQYIEPDSIKELKYFPYVNIGLIALGILAFIINKKWAYLVWAILLAVLGALGIYDFYLWLYDYGNNLDPMAPIKIPGMSFMPPLFGEKDLLNFYVKSYPGWGGILLGLATISGGIAFLSYKKPKRRY